MKPQRIIRKIAFAAFWLAIGGGMLTLLIAAMGKQKRDHCRDFQVTLRGDSKIPFVNVAQVESILKKTAKGSIKGQSKASLDLQRMEAVLEKNVWIRDAELYFDNHDVLHISVAERQPIARIFSVAGKSFYIDETCTVMPLSTEHTARVPVFTGFSPKVISPRDSALLRDVRSLATFILEDPFWMAQVGHVDITNQHEFEIHPVVGSHVVRIGKATDIEKKFHRLFVFYSSVLDKAGLGKYSAIDVQYAGQVVGIRPEGNSLVDSARLRQNIERLLRQSVEIPTEEELAARELREQRKLKVDAGLSAVEKPSTPIESPIDEKEVDKNPGPVKTSSEPPKESRVPKAVMGRLE